MTTVLNAYSTAYPDITNRLMASVYLQSDPQALIATIVEAGVHSERIWTFPGLPRNNYGFRLDEIDIAGTVIANLAKFDVVPGEVDGELVRDDEQIQAGVTPGFANGTNTFTFDGTDGKPDYRGWEIVPSELTGRGILVRNIVDYSWNKDTGKFLLLIPGDIFPNGIFYNIHFNSQTDPKGNSYPTVSDFQINVITDTAVIDATYFGKKLIVEPIGTYMTVTLPPIATIVQGRPLMIEVGGTGVYTVQIVSPDAMIKWFKGKIYMMAGESLTLYKYVRAGVGEIRVFNSEGNFKTVGTVVSNDDVQVNVFNMQLMDGSIKSASQYARIYNEFVLHLPLGQTVSYDAWAIGDNKRYFSLVNSSNQFHFPDRRGLYERANDTGKSGDYLSDTVGPHSHKFKRFLDRGIDTGNAGADGFDLQEYEDTTFENTGTTETRPKTYLINKYVLI